jgi:hypothetical protein
LPSRKSPRFQLVINDSRIGLLGYRHQEMPALPQERRLVQWQITPVAGPTRASLTRPQWQLSSILMSRLTVEN